MKKKIRFTLILTLFVYTVKAQVFPTVGKEFWFAFMESGRFGAATTAVNLSLTLTSTQNTTATINIVNSSAWTQTVSLLANQATVVQIPGSARDVFYSQGSDVINSNGVLQVVSPDSIAVAAVSQSSASTDGSVILPLATLGNETKYTLLAHPPSNINDGYSEFIIAATQDNTEIQITPTVNIASRATIANTGTLAHAAGVPYTITLQKGETYQAQSLSGANNNTGDLTGTIIEPLGNCKTFAVYGGTTYSHIPSGSQDHLYEQMFPNNTLGKQYLVSPFLLAVNYRYRVLATEDNTSVTISGGTGTITLNRGQYFTQDLNNQTRYITADKPIAVAQYMRTGSANGANTGDPAMVIINPLEQTINAFTYVAANLQVPASQVTHGINIIATTATANSNQIFLDGVPLPPSDFQTFPDLPTYSYASKQVSQAGHSVVSNGDPVIAYAYGIKSVESYAYSAGANFENLAYNFNVTSTPACVGEPVDFQGFGQNITSYAWDFGDGTPITTPIVDENATHTYTTPGNYTVTMEVTLATGACSDYSNFKFIEIVDTASFLPNTAEICPGGSIVLDPYPGNDTHITQYVWFKDGVPIISAINSKEITVTEEGVYVVQHTNKAGCMTPDTVQVIEVTDPPPPVWVGNIDTDYCEDSDAVILDGTATPVGGTFKLSNGVTTLDNATELIPADWAGSTVTITYTFLYGGTCVEPDPIEYDVVINNLPTPTITLDNFYCAANDIDLPFTANLMGGEFDLYKGINLILDNATTFNPQTLEQTAGVGSYRVEYNYTDGNGCSATTEALINIGFTNVQINNLQEGTKYCQQAESFTLQGSPLGGEFSIDGNIITDFDPASLAPGIYDVVYNDFCSTDTVNIEIIENQVAEIQGPPTVCTFSGDTITLSVSGDWLSYEWVAPDDEFVYVLSNQPTLDVVESKRYQVTVENEFGCVTIDDVVIEEFCDPKFFLPTAFTPNNDGKNDEFKVFGRHFDEFELQIIDRWGAVVFFSDNPQNTWDGSYRGEDLPSGGYAVIVKYRDLPDGEVKELKSKLSLIR